jgi:hypothetical protein
VGRPVVDAFGHRLQQHARIVEIRGGLKRDERIAAEAIHLVDVQRVDRSRPGVRQQPRPVRPQVQRDRPGDAVVDVVTDRLDAVLGAPPLGVLPLRLDGLPLLLLCGANSQVHPCSHGWSPRT